MSLMTSNDGCSVGRRGACREKYVDADTWDKNILFGVREFWVLRALGYPEPWCFLSPDFSPRSCEATLKTLNPKPIGALKGLRSGL